MSNKDKFQQKRYHQLIEDIEKQNLHKDDDEEKRKTKLKNISTIIKNFRNKGSLLNKIQRYTVDPLIYYGSYVINELECILKDSYNNLTVIKDPTVKTTLTIWPSDKPNSKNKMISSMDVNIKSDDFPYSNMDSVEGYIKQLVNHIEYVQFDSLPEEEKEKKRAEGKDVKLLKPIRKEFTIFGVDQGKSKQEPKTVVGGKSKKNGKTNKKRKHSKTMKNKPKNKQSNK